MPKRKTVALKLGTPNEYNPDYLVNNFTEKELRQEYSRLRKVSIQRLDALKNSEFEDFAVSQNKKVTKTLAEIPKGKRAIARALVQQEQFLFEKPSTLTQLRERKQKTLRTFKQHGYDFVNEQNYNRFISYLDDERIKKLKELYDSERIAEVFRVGEKHKIKTDDLLKNFELWEENLEEIEDVELPKGKRHTSRNIARELGIYEDYFG